MDTIFAFFDWVSTQFQVVVDFIKSLPYIFSNIFSYIQLFYLKMKIAGQIEFIKMSYVTAQMLLQEIGFNDLLAATFNAMPSEIRFYAFKFGIPQGLSIVANFFTTGFVMRMTR
ncbi:MULTISPECIES: DUF2523 family protein [Vibrio]|uniref:DUF2523 domain-containing protein n=2 Tax=Vibrio TaxID=662 RepID=A0A1C3J1F7_9VIBR|nr:MULTISPECIES: DUF2523 family protein [Vibrio]OEF51882.1 DUF2523 domain-containing protein [Vibrio tasmaniensis 1F-267]SBS61703.1 hypothetical protein VAT7223_00794 [Vibrio atlanticus]SBS67513.1 hypothetical protein VAT7223_03762 [Vibrio atlanticus]